MKYLVFIRGENDNLRKLTVAQIMEGLNPDINTVRAIRVSMFDHEPFRDKGERKAAASSVKKMVRKLLSGSFQEQFIVIDNPNVNPSDWRSMFRIADDLGIETLGVGIDVEKMNTDQEDGQKNEQDQNLHLFIASMYKYAWVENEQAIPPAVETLLNLT